MADANGLNCIVTHIYREGNQVADLLANHGLTLTSIFYSQEAPTFYFGYFCTKQVGLA